MVITGYYLGCPSWGLKDWVGNLYRRGSRAKEFLAQYAEVFNTVEGNTTFYSLPNADAVKRWRDATPESFRFSFKLPRTISHEKALVGAEREAIQFLDRLRPLGERLGPFMIQLPPSFGPQKLDVLGRFLAALPSDQHFGVEVRHRDFYDEPTVAAELDQLLAHFACERVAMDTRALRSGPASDDDVVKARQRKPDLPVPHLDQGLQPLVRLVGHPDPEINEPWLAEWTEIVARWLLAGRRPYVFAHCPNDLHAPPMARRFHDLLGEQLDVRQDNAKNKPVEIGTLPTWPGEVSEEPAAEQLSLF